MTVGVASGRKCLALLLTVYVLHLLARLCTSYDFRFSARYTFHHVLHNAHIYARMSAKQVYEKGVLEMAREFRVVPYGYTRPIEWTNDLPTDVRRKRDAVPVNIVENLLVHDAMGRRVG